jgi:hypothetical protein
VQLQDQVHIHVHPHPWVGKTDLHPPPGFDRIAKKRMKQRQNGHKSAKIRPAPETFAQPEPL